MTGRALEDAKQGISDLLEVGHGLRLPNPTRSEVVDIAVLVDGDRAVVTACVIDDAVIFQRFSGRVVNDRAISAWTEAELIRSAAGWRVARNTYLSETEGTGGCGDR
jgi:hypothetical protein